MSMLSLSPLQRKELKANAHHLQPVVYIGASGLTPAVLKEIDAALNAHQLIKIRVFSDERHTREDFCTSVCTALHAAPVQHIGKLLVIWRASTLPQPRTTQKIAPTTGRAPRITTVVKPAAKVGQKPTKTTVTLFGNQRVTAGGLVKRVKKRATASSIKKQHASN